MHFILFVLLINLDEQYGDTIVSISLLQNPNLIKMTFPLINNPILILNFFILLFIDDQQFMLTSKGSEYHCSRVIP